jgi:hypothetical protein
MCGETTSTSYRDTDLQQYIATYPIINPDACPAQILGYVTRNGIDQPVVTYDLHAAAADIWQEKQASLIASGSWDVSGPGGGFQKSQEEEQHEKQVAYHLARRHAQSIFVKSQQASCDYRRSVCLSVRNVS